MYQITSIFYKYIDSGERIAEKHDGSSTVIEGSPNNKTTVRTMWPIYMKNQLLFFSIVVIVVDYLLCDEMFIALRRPGHTFAVPGARAIQIYLILPDFKPYLNFLPPFPLATNFSFAQLKDETITKLYILLEVRKPQNDIYNNT